MSASLAKFCQSSAQVIPKFCSGSAQDVPKSSSVLLSDTHQVSISQQMSRVIAFDIAVLAQKVKVVNEDRCDLKKVGAAGGSVVSMFGWLSELLTELTMQYHSPTETEKVGYISKIGFNLNRIFGPILGPYRT